MKGLPPIPLPEGFLKRMKGQLGNQFEDFIDALNAPLPPSIRLHPVKKANQYEFELNDPVRWGIQAYYLDKRPVFTLDPVFHGGGYYVQEPSSMLIEGVIKNLLENIDYPCVLDLCASPGGKSTSILSQLNGKGLLVSNEIISSRVSGLHHNLVKWGFSNQVLTQSDPERFKHLPGFFDLVLVDAPCSGEGLFRKDTTSRSEWSEYYTGQCKLRQQRILRDIFDAIKPGGLVIYSTCTFNPEENIDQLHFLQNMGMTSITTPELDNYPLIKIERGNTYGYQAYPHLMKGEGFFIGILQKTSENPVTYPMADARIINWIKPPWQGRELSPLVPGISSFMHHETYYMFPEDKKYELEKLSGALRIIEAGAAWGQLKNDDFIPAHSWALNTLCPMDLKTMDLDKEQAIRYLRKETITTGDDRKGYLLIRHQGLNLGWVKGLKDRVNNLYPKNYRILMSG
ncbi:MAG: hypothetical protein SH818_10365 [Saprospiraceae bacterium]|nr:hypothetical protein [Saprospiraceae bacterium]